ncbi:MAG: hypothetical protein Kow0074_16870 [Candidatus Zixiibacteriota bacterium]
MVQMPLTLISVPECSAGKGITEFCIVKDDLFGASLFGLTLHRVGSSHPSSYSAHIGYANINKDRTDVWLPQLQICRGHARLILANSVELESEDMSGGKTGRTSRPVHAGYR